MAAGGVKCCDTDLTFLAGTIYSLRKVSPKTMDRNHAVKVKAVFVSRGPQYISIIKLPIIVAILHTVIAFDILKTVATQYT
jgi:hypothetical protein